MALPHTVRVKLSSEAAESISITAVVAQDLPLRELVEHMLGIAGKDESRIREILLRGTLVVGASRFRWAGWEADLQDLHGLIATFPDPDPSRPFAPARCVRAALRGDRRAIDIPREAAEEGRPFRGASFWQKLMEIVATGATYAGYSYRDRADRYTRALSAEDGGVLREACDELKYSALRDQIRSMHFAAAELWVTRD